jgi:beta-galactosidase
MVKRPGFLFILFLIFAAGCDTEKGAEESPRLIIDFNPDWKFILSDPEGAEGPGFADEGWRILDLPHDWSVEGEFSPGHPAGIAGGALPGGIGWYRKSFPGRQEWEGKDVFIEFDGVYRNSEVWINGTSLGMRPNGYISFRYELTGHLYTDGRENVLAVRVDNSQQPNSRWYSGSGIYRQVRLVVASPVRFAHWQTFVHTPEVTGESAMVKVSTKIRNSREEPVEAEVTFHMLDRNGRNVASTSVKKELEADSETPLVQELWVENPSLWSTEDPALYRILAEINLEGKATDRETVDFGIRTFSFDASNGFSLNGVPMKIKGVCNHHDLGALGAAAYPRAMERQLEMLKEMGCNAIRTSHNPPSPVLLDLCDRMGFLVMDETFDMWKRGKTKYDYHLDWDRWYEQDLRDHILRDRNHPSVILWSIGNEIPDQGHSEGRDLAVGLAGIVRELDPTRPVTAGCNYTSPDNSILASGAVDLVGFNYHLEDYDSVPVNFPGMPFIATETTSALATRGHYDMPSDSVRVWPERWDRHFGLGNPDQTCSSYDNCHVPWGSTHEEALLYMEEKDFVSGIFVWTGFDYLGEPTPYDWPSRSSYFGIIDLAGFPKDAYYLYQSRWTDQPVLHLFPHWNWQESDTVDVWAYTSCSEAELFLNGESLGKRILPEGSLHMQWRVPYRPGKLEARGMFNGKEITAVVETSGKAAGLKLKADRETIHADGMDLSFVTVDVVDAEGRMVPGASVPVSFTVDGPGILEAVDNGLQTSLESFKADHRTTFNGKCLAIVRSDGSKGSITLSASADGLIPADIEITAN